MCWAAPPALLSPLMGVYVDRLGAKAAPVAGYVAAGCAALAMSGFEAAFVLDSASYLLGAVVVLLLTARPADGPDRPADGPDRPGWGRELAEGITILARHAGSRLVTLMTAAVSFTSGAFLVVEPLYARHLLHRPPSQLALFEAAAGVGAMVAGFAVPRARDRLNGRSALAASAICYGLAASVFIGTTSVPIAYLGAFAWGGSGAVFVALSLTTLQQLAPMHAHGRIMGVITTIESALSTIGLPLAGVTLAVLGIRPGALCLVAIALITGVICLLAGTATARRKDVNGASSWRKL